ncbi:MAG: ATP-dependent helicase HrpB [Chitinophagales bacterium]
MSFHYDHIDLPVKEIIPQLKEFLAKESTIILKAPTGAGKSTLVPIALLEEAWLNNQKILLLEPRRLAAKTIAMRMAELLGEPVGQTVGYRIRFENKVSNATRLEVLTEGILTRMLQDDNALEGVGLVIFDEFHERSIHADVAMALCRETQQVLRPDLRMLVMSATIDMPQLAAMLGASVMESKGRQFPVDIQYVGDSDEYVLPELAASVVKKAIQENEGDVLVFLPGEGEIKKCAGLLQRSLPKGMQIHPLYGMLTSAQQYAAIMPDKEGRRKVVLATNIAETSLTIEGIKVVVDSGFERRARFDANSGLSRLETVQISKESADQRAGRAGRLSPGVCYRMWTLATHHRMEAQSTPEIEQADLCNLVLDMAQWGIVDAHQLTWVTPPPKGHLRQASQLLHALEALENNRITEHGRQLHRLPTHPRIAHMLLKAQELDLLPLATDIAPLLEERDPLPPDTGIDINLRIEALRRFRKEGSGNKRLKRIEKTAAQYRKMFDLSPENGSVNEFETGLLIAFAYPERIACARRGNNAQFQMANGKIAMAGHRDDLAHEAWLAVAHVADREGAGKIFMASPIDPKDLAPMVRSKEVITWDTRKGGLIASKDMRIGSIVLQSIPLPDPDDDQLIQAICEAIEKEGQTLLNWDESVEQWQSRVMSLRKWNPKLHWPNVSTETLLLTNSEWLSPYLNEVKKPEDLKKIDLKMVLHYSLPMELQQLLDQLAPERIEIPTGAKVKLQYHQDGSPPVLAVRLQDCFGLKKTPTVNNGQINVLMHLQSPGFKVVQVTHDLESFWRDTYFEVRKELKIRYHKHAWPEDPLTATPGRKRQ